MSSLPNNSSIPNIGSSDVFMAGPRKPSSALNNDSISTNVSADTPQPNLVKRVVKNIRRRHTISSIQKEQKEALPASERMSYHDKYVIVPDSELAKVGGKKCMKYDKYNEAIWKRNLDHYQRMQRVHSRRAHSAIKIENPLEDLPQVSNFERYIIHEQRHQPTDCLEQTSAILYLCSNPDYQLVDDLGSVEIQNMQSSKPGVIFFEAHQAIELANARVQATGDNDYMNIIQKMRNGITILNNADRQSLSSAISQNRVARSYSQKLHTVNKEYNMQDIPLAGHLQIPSQQLQQHHDTIIDMAHQLPNMPTQTWLSSETYFGDNSINNRNNDVNNNGDNNGDNDIDGSNDNNESYNSTSMKCCVPEHHKINEKVKHFDSLAINGCGNNIISSDSIDIPVTIQRGFNGVQSLSRNNGSSNL